MHAVADTPEGPFTPTSAGPNGDGIVVSPESHNPTIVRASDGTYLLFSIGRSPLLSSRSVMGPWAKVPGFPACNNPAPVVVPGADTIYVYCHNGPNPGHWGSSIGMIWADRWDTGVWKSLSNNSEDLYDGGRAIFNHPVEDPFAWWANGSFHLLMHGFRMGMVNGTSQSEGGPRKGNAYGAYATAPTAFGPWQFQEALILLIMKFK